MSKKNINSDGKKISKSNFYKNEKLLKIDDIDANKYWCQGKSLCYKKILKYFIGFDDNDVIKPPCIKLPQIIGYVKCFDSNKTMSFKVSDKELLKKYSKNGEELAV